MFRGIIVFYLAGTMIALCLNIYRLFLSISTATSIRARNLKKIGYYFNLSKGAFVETKPSALLVSFTILDLLIISPLLSWLPVVLALFNWFRVRANKMPTPEKLKELQFRLATSDLTKEQVERTYSGIRELLSTYGFQNAAEEYEDTNSLCSGKYNEYRIMPTAKRIRLCWHTPDYDSTGEAIYEYKMDGYNVESRLFEQFTGEYSIKERNVYVVKDGAVLETEIRERAQKDKFSVSLGETVDEKIAKLNSETKWTILPISKLKYFIMSKHPHFYPDGELKRYFRQELERFKSGFNKLKVKAQENGYVISNTDYGTQIHCPDNAGDSERKQLSDTYETVFTKQIFTEAGLSQSEFSNSIEIIEMLSVLLDEKNPFEMKT